MDQIDSDQHNEIHSMGLLKKDSAGSDGGSDNTVLRLSDDIGKMADRIGDMADRIGDMSDQIVETQRIQSDNLQATQKTMLEMVEMMSDQAKLTNRILEMLVSKGLEDGLFDD